MPFEYVAKDATILPPSDVLTSYLSHCMKAPSFASVIELNSIFDTVDCVPFATHTFFPS